MRTIIRKKEQWGAGIQLNLDYEISINLRTDKVENIFIYYRTLFDIIWHHLSKTYNKFVVVVENLNLIESNDRNITELLTIGKLKNYLTINGYISLFFLKASV